MTIKDAHSIQLALAELEFPRIFSISVFFAIFKVGRCKKPVRLFFADADE